MKSSKTILVLLLVILSFWICPKISSAAEPKKPVAFSIPSQYDDLSYVCVQFKGFPFGVLWHLRGMASSIKQQIPEGLHVGREMKSGQGYLLFSYQKKPEGVLLSMRYQRLSAFSSQASVMDVSSAPVDHQFLISEDSDSMVMETLKELFSRFCLAWQQDRIPADLEEIMSGGIKIASIDPAPLSFGSIAYDR